MVRELPPDLAKIAKDELNEKPNLTNNDVQHLKEWISKQPHLRARTGKLGIWASSYWEIFFYGLLLL